jgi:ribonuclease HI
MYFDGSKQVGGSWVGIIPKYPKREKLKYVLQFNATNNMAEYESLMHASTLQRTWASSKSNDLEIQTWYLS